MPIPITCPHCGTVYKVADDLVGRKLLCKECDRPVMVGAKAHESPGRRAPRRVALKEVVLALALLPAVALGALWWTGWLWDQVDWPPPDLGGLGADEPAVMLHLAGVEEAGGWDGLSHKLGHLADGGRADYISAAINRDRATVIISPVKDAEAFARRVDIGSVECVHDGVVTINLTGR
jgi:hypothetical protein